MTKPVRLDAFAEREASDAFAWYEARQAGLGERFLERLARTLAQIEQAPDACSPVKGKFEAPVRSAPVERFPYRLVFVELPDRWREIAVAHTSREPDYWLGRLDTPR